jgi:hypothetical protein
MDTAKESRAEYMKIWRQRKREGSGKTVSLPKSHAQRQKEYKLRKKEGQQQYEIDDEKKKKAEYMRAWRQRKKEEAKPSTSATNSTSTERPWTSSATPTTDDGEVTTMIAERITDEDCESSTYEYSRACIERITQVSFCCEESMVSVYCFCPVVCWIYVAKRAGCIVTGMC